MTYEFLKRAQTPFEGAELEPKAGSTHIVGFGYDGTACFRKGTRVGPAGLRSVVYGIESYSPYLNKSLENISLVDLGDLVIDENLEVEAQWKKATKDYQSLMFELAPIKKGHRYLTIGGEHSISYAPIVEHLKAFDDLVVLHLDAHADLRDGYEGYHYSHASIMRRALDHFGEGHDLLLYGIRSGTEEEYKWMREHGTLSELRAEFLSLVRAIPAERPVYLTLDLDYFDPSFFPGTGTPEPGGEDFHSFVSLMKILCEKRFVGADVVELAPDIDPTGNSSVFAAKVVREILLAMG